MTEFYETTEEAEEAFDEYLDEMTGMCLKALGIPVDAAKLMALKYHLEDIFDDGFTTGLMYLGVDPSEVADDTE